MPTFSIIMSTFSIIMWQLWKCEVMCATDNRWDSPEQASYNKEASREEQDKMYQHPIWYMPCCMWEMHGGRTQSLYVQW